MAEGEKRPGPGLEIQKNIAAEDISPQREPVAEEKSRQELAQLKDRMKEVERMVPPEHLELLAEASGGFHYRWAWDLADKFLQEGILMRGYTDLRTKDIYINPIIVAGLPELGIKPMNRREIQGFYYHEAGHHAKEVGRFQDDMMADLKDPEVVPEIYRGDEQTEVQFLQALHSHLHNTLADIWDESYMGRDPYAAIRAAVEEKGAAAPDEMRQLQKMGLNKPEQFCQLVLRGRYNESEEFLKKMKRDQLTPEYVRQKSKFQDSVDPEVFDAYVKSMSSGAIRATMRQQEFESPFVPDWKKEQNRQRRFTAYKEVVLPEYLKLVEKEVEQRQQAKQQAESGLGQPGQPGQAGSAGSSEAVPLTPGEQREILEQLAKELEKAGQERGALAPAPEEKNKEKGSLDDLRRKVKERLEALQTGQPQPESHPEDQPAGPEGMDKVRQLARQLERQNRERQQRGLAEQMGIRQESIRSWENTREKYREAIESLAADLAEVFLADRRKYRVHHRRSGEITPGLEYETVAAIAGGETDPATRTDIKQNPEFLETEMELIYDTSGSMTQGGRLEHSVALGIIVVEAFKRIRELLAAEDLLDPREEQPFRVGVTKFAATPQRVTSLEEPLSDRKEITIIDKVSVAGGGTDEVEAVAQTYQKLSLGKNRVIKIIMIFSDGQGNKEGLAPMMQQIEQDDKVLFMAIGMGDSEDFAKDVTESYLAPLRDQRAANIFAYATDKPQSAIPEVIKFLKREVEKRRQ